MTYLKNGSKNLIVCSVVKLVFLHPNVTSVIQSMDQWVIKSLKSKPNTADVKIKALGKNQPYPEISILQPLTTLVSSWNAVPLDVIVNWFFKARISDSSQQVFLTDEDDPIKELIEELDELREANREAVLENVSTESFSTVNDHAIVTASAACHNFSVCQ